ncbi:putative mitochondrial protein [Drosera capensis]
MMTTPRAPFNPKPIPCYMPVVNPSHPSDGRPVRTLSEKEIRERRKNNQCFFCDEKYVPGHRYRKGQFKAIEMNFDQGEKVELIEDMEENRELSLMETLRQLRRWGCSVVELEGALEVVVADGNGLRTKTVCKGFESTMVGSNFKTDVMKLPLGGCEMVLRSIMGESLNHLRKTLRVLKQNSLFAKRNKCVFGAQQVEYLGHVISHSTVSTDPSKVEAMVKWLDVWIFMIFTSFYKADVDYKEQFLCRVIIVFISTSLSPKNAAIFVYDKELLAVVYANDKWRSYLLGRRFIVRTVDEVQKLEPMAVLARRLMKKGNSAGVEVLLQ